MSIKAGSGKGSADAGGTRGGGGSFGGSGSRKRRNKTPFAENPPPKKPLKPIENTFPEKKAFRLGIYRVEEERDNYLICTGYDPNAKDPFAEIMPTAFRTIKVSKPWQDEEVVEVPYEVGDLLVAVEIKKNAAVDGMEVTDESGTRLRWMDLNIGGRRPAQVRYAKLTSALSAASAFLTGATTASAVFVAEDENNPGDLAATVDTLTITNRWVDLSLSSGKYVVVQKIQSEWVIIASECP